MTDIMRVRAILNGFTGGPGLNTFYFRPGVGGGSTADATDVCARVRAFWNAISARLHTSITVSVVPIVDVIDDATGTLTGSFASTAPPTTVTGTGVGDLYATQCQALLQLNTATIIGGRKIQGRSFIGPVHEGDCTNGIYATPARSNVEGSALLQMLSGTFPTSSEPVVWHRPKNGAGGQYVLVTAYSCPAKIATLKSRRDG